MKSFHLYNIFIELSYTTRAKILWQKLNSKYCWKNSSWVCWWIYITKKWWMEWNQVSDHIHNSVFVHNV